MRFAFWGFLRKEHNFTNPILNQLMTWLHFHYLMWNQTMGAQDFGRVGFLAFFGVRAFKESGHGNMSFPSALANMKCVKHLQCESVCHTWFGCTVRQYFFERTYKFVSNRFSPRKSRIFIWLYPWIFFNLHWICFHKILCCHSVKTFWKITIPPSPFRF
jgi:hypothetical protein